MSRVVLTCPNCSCGFPKDSKEITRQRKKRGENTLFFCGEKCAGLYRYAESREAKIKNLVCRCGNPYVTSTDSGYCSRRCASLYSFSEHRRIVLARVGKSSLFRNDFRALRLAADGLRNREAPKYILMSEFLIEHGVTHQFEFALETTKSIFDLHLPEENILIEFDENYHSTPDQMERDFQKDRRAVDQGYTVYRVDVRGMTAPYPASLMRFLLNRRAIEQIKDRYV
jgi:very-short-patch-repair endonuclease